MIYPTITEYIEAIRFSEDNFDKLTNLVPVLKDNGEPYYSSGNFAVVFKMKDKESGKLHAVKCFLKDQEGRVESYRKISDYLESIENRYLIKTKFLENELFVDSKNTDQTEFSVVVMDWVEGVPLDVYIREKINDKMYLEYLCYTFSLMAQNLIEQEFAHGDLKPDNILVKEDGMLVLVDYDGMYVPEMFGERSRELGSPDFQHPDRKLIDFDKHLDDFSLASILLSLKLISIDPSLLDKFGDKDRLLFSREDYREFPGSEINAEIFKHFENKEVLNIYHLFLQALGRKMCVWNKEMWKLEVPEIDNLKYTSYYTNTDTRDNFILKYTSYYTKIRCDEIHLDFPKPFDWELLESLSTFDDDSLVYIGLYKINYPSSTSDVGYGLSILFDLVEKNNSKAQLALGICMHYGIGVPINLPKAFDLYEKSAKQGDSDGQFHLGLCYDYGYGVPIDEQRAVYWYSKSADQDNFDGLLYLMLFYVRDNEKGAFFKAKIFSLMDYEWDSDEYWDSDEFYAFTESIINSFERLDRNAKLGYARSQHELGNYYAKIGAFEKAVEIYSKLAEKGNVEAKFELGNCYENGTGVARDLDRAIDLWIQSGTKEAKLKLIYTYISEDCKKYSQAIELINEFINSPNYEYYDYPYEAKMILAKCYANGWGVFKDLAMADYLRNDDVYPDAKLKLIDAYLSEDYKKYSQAIELIYEILNTPCEDGHYQATMRLSECYANGWGVEKDLSKAKSLRDEYNRQEDYFFDDF